MRIAFAMINCNRRDGSARPVNEVAERLARRGHDVHLFARKAEDLDLGLVRWHRIPGPGWPEVLDFSTYHLLANIRFRRRDFDVVHSIGCNTARADVVTIQNIQPAKSRVVERFVDGAGVSLPRRFTRWLYDRVTSSAEHRIYTCRPGVRPPLFLPVSRGVEAELREHYDIGDAPVRIIPNAADTAIFHPVDEVARAAWRSANGFGPGDLICLFSGGEWARKGLDLAIRAIGLIDRPEVKLFVAGDDAERERFKSLAVECGAGLRVVFGGFRRDIAAVMGASDLFLFPSHYEAFSLATLEASACGLPIVATKINGIEDLIRPGENGEFISRDPSQIARVLTPLLAAPAALRSMGAAARAIVERTYTWDRVATMTEEAYRSVLE